MLFNKKYALSTFLYETAERLPRNCNKKKLWTLANVLVDSGILTVEELKERLKND